MRASLLLLLTVVSAAALATTVDTAPPERAERDWVRTIDGWQPLGSFQPDRMAPPALHPFVVAGLQGLGSVLALLAFERRRSAPEND